ncbi:MAG TPA: transposase domain-containing protein [Gemmataceae bacterium]|nr:transposase domain-containing protein [Gemmataceae bacterium]
MQSFRGALGSGQCSPDPLVHHLIKPGFAEDALGLLLADDLLFVRGSRPHLDPVGHLCPADGDVPVLAAPLGPLPARQFPDTLDPFDYLRDAFGRIPRLPVGRLDEFLPDRRAAGGCGKTA